MGGKMNTQSLESSHLQSMTGCSRGLAGTPSSTDHQHGFANFTARSASLLIHCLQGRPSEGHTHGKDIRGGGRPVSGSGGTKELHSLQEGPQAQGKETEGGPPKRDLVF